MKTRLRHGDPRRIDRGAMMVMVGVSLIAFTALSWCAILGGVAP